MPALHKSGTFLATAETVGAGAVLKSVIGGRE